MSKYFIVALSLFALAVLPSCFGGGSTVQLSRTSDIPAAEGTVDVTSDDNKNSRIRVVVRHLAPSTRIRQDSTAYVVWARGMDSYASAQNLGALTLDDNLNGTLETVTPLQVLDVFVTAEPSSTASTPTGKELMTARVSRK